MLNPNALFSQQVAVVGIIDPDAYAASTVTTAWIAAKDFAQYMAIIMAGTLVTNAVLSAKLQEATDGSGTGAADIAGKAITNLTEAGTDSDKQAIINLRRNELSQGCTHFRLSMTLATAGGDAGAIVLGGQPRQNDASDNDLAAVDEIVA